MYLHLCSQPTADLLPADAAVTRTAQSVGDYSGDYEERDEQAREHGENEGTQYECTTFNVVLQFHTLNN